MATKLELTTTLPLLNSPHRIPQLGFGLYKSEPGVAEASSAEALKVGYRHLDSAQFYANEAQAGAAWTKSGLKREDVYLTTKILFSAGSVEKNLQKCRESVKKMDPREGGYVDLFLIHSPNAGPALRKEFWLTLEALKKEGLARDIGVANYGRGHIEEIREFGTIWPPVINQVELHPWCQQREAVAYCQEQGILVQAYCPVVRMQRQYDETLVRIAKETNKSTTQVLIRWSLQRGFVPLPKSDTPSRIKENADVYDFELTSEQMKALTDLDEGKDGSIVQAVVNHV